jgi:hypothetical protein
MLPTKFHIIWPSGFRGKAVLEIDQSELLKEMIDSGLSAILIKVASMGMLLSIDRCKLELFQQFVDAGNKLVSESTFCNHCILCIINFFLE